MKINIVVRSYLFCFITILFWSTLEVISKPISGMISPTAMTAFRFLIGGFVILPFALKQIQRDKIKLSWKDLSKISLPGIINVTISMLLLQLSVHYGKASLAAIIISINPIFVAIFASFILKEKVDLLKIIGITGGIFGLIIILSQENLHLAESRSLLIGVIFGLLASISFGLYTVLSKKYVAQFGNLILNSFSFIIGSVILIVVSAVIGRDLSFPMNAKIIVPLLYMGIFITGLAYLIFFEALKHIPAASGSMFFFLKPVLASVLAYFTLNEHLNVIQMLGIIIVIVSISIDKWSFKSNRKRIQKRDKQ